MNKDKRIYLLFLIMLIGALFEIVGISFFLPLITQDENDKVYIVLESFFNNININFNNTNIAIFIVVLFVIKFILLNIQNYYIYKNAFSYMYKAKIKFFTLINTSNYLTYLELGVDKINNIATKEIEKSSISIQYFLQMVVNFIYTMGYFVLALYINYQIVIASIVIGLSVVYIQKIITIKIIHYSKEIVKGNNNTNLISLQILNNMKYLKSTNTFFLLFNKFKLIAEKHSFNSHRISFFNSIPKNVPEFIGVVIISILIILNELYFHEKIITVMFLGMLMYRLLAKLLSVQKSYQNFLINVGAIEQLMYIENVLLNNQEESTANNKERRNIEQFSSIKLTNTTLHIEDKLILNGFNYTFSTNSVTGIVGESGAGKTSLLNLILSIYKQTSGSIHIDNINTKDIDINNFRNNIGYVSQESIIFEDSLTNNVIFGNTYEANKFNQLIKLLNLEDIKDRNLLMDGINISGGQRQRISIARELYKNPSVLILDEATSSLDATIEKRIINNILELKNNLIIIIVAHRLSTLVNVDKIIFLEQGKIRDVASMNVLYNKDDVFKKLCNNQNIYLNDN